MNEKEPLKEQEQIDEWLGTTDRLYINLLETAIRSENIPLKQLIKLANPMPFGLRSNILSLVYFLEDEQQQQRFLLGRKGSGKTLAVLIALLKFCMENKDGQDNLAFVRFDPQTHTIKTHYLSKYSSLEELENHTPSLIVIDDLHYMLEYCYENHAFLTDVLNLLESVVKKKTKILLISEEPLLFYAEKLQDERLNKLCHTFGQFAKFCDMSDDLNYMAFSEIGYLTLENWLKFAVWAELSIDREILEICFFLNPTPRTLVKLVHLFESTTITFEQFFTLTKKRLQNINLPWELENVLSEGLTEPIFDSSYCTYGEIFTLSRELTGDEEAKTLAKDTRVKLLEDEQFKVEVAERFGKSVSYPTVINFALLKYGYDGFIRKAKLFSSVYSDKAKRIFDSVISVRPITLVSEQRSDPDYYREGIFMLPFELAFPELQET